ncbi:YcdB/YcdC domain-containing protein [Paenibacillus turpanensis]|uniref:YcdB/YcdC domain-containing protein n=1 Tax=Paenibacillus turpanensis TaxID=2689078 RepID=UPI00140A826B|nr:YcdB/YcdC domain-containing protein [Paenibacillus turpanensis]
MDFDQLRAIASSIVNIPEHYRLEMEDSIPVGEPKERCFIWESEEKDQGKIEITLDLETGKLTSLSIEVPNSAIEEALSDLEGQETSRESIEAAADVFVTQFVEGCAELTWKKVTKRGKYWDVEYCKQVGGLPLPDSGCEVMLDAALRIVRFRLHRRRDAATKMPEWPEKVADVQTLRERFLEGLTLQPMIASLYSSIYEVGQDEPDFRLVYGPIPDFQMLDAATGDDLFGRDHYVMPPSRPIPAPAATQSDGLSNDQNKASLLYTSEDWELQLGIDRDNYRLVKTADDEERIKLYYELAGQADEVPQPDALSVDGYMKRKWGDQLRKLDSSIIVSFEKSTERLVGLFRTSEQETGSKGERLSRQQCWEAAERFLQFVLPDYLDYLQLEDAKAKDDEESREDPREFFYLPVFVHGFPVENNRVTVSVDAYTGKVLMYMGVSYEMLEKMAAAKLQPSLSQEEAFERFAPHVQLRLRWFLDREAEPPVYRLIYDVKALIQGSGEREHQLSYIDAVDGGLIWRKEAEGE